MPFGPYSDFEDCVRQNQDKDTPEAFCAFLHFEITGEWPGAAKDKARSIDMLDALKNKGDFLLAEALLKNPGLSIKQVEEIIEGLENWTGEAGDFVSSIAEEHGIEDPESFGEWLAYEATGKIPAEKTQGDPGRFVLGGPFAMKDEARRIVTAPVLVPGEPDADGETVSKETIDRVAMEFMEKYQLVDVGHSFNKSAVPVESWILRNAEKFGDMNLPRGTWMMSAKVNDQNTWAGILAGKYNGFSITGVRRDDAPTFKSAGVATADKRKTLLGDLGDGWIAATVSIVENPAVWKSKWVAIKSEESSLLSRVRTRLNKLTGKSKTNEEVDMKPEEVKQIAADAAKEAVAEALKEKGEKDKKKEDETALVDRVKALEEKLSKDSKKDGDDAAKGPDDKSEKEKGLDLTTQIAGVKEEMLKVYDEEDSDEKTEKLSGLKQKLSFYEELSGKKSSKEDGDNKGDEDSIEALKSKVEDLTKRLSAKTRSVDHSDSKDDDVATKGNEIKRDLHGRRIHS